MFSIFAKWKKNKAAEPMTSDATKEVAPESGFAGHAPSGLVQVRSLMRRCASRPIHYDKSRQKPVIRASICTGEKTAGFQDLQSKKFTAYQLIRDEQDLREFKEACGVGELETIY